MKVEDIMTRDVQSCRPENVLAEAAIIMWERDCGCVPVVDGEGKVTGMITDRDICMAVATRQKLATEISVADVMSGVVKACAPDEDISDALALMEQERLHRLPVLNDKGALAGLLSFNDVVLHARKGGGKRHVSHKEVMRTLKALCEHRTQGEASDDSQATDERQSTAV